MQVKASQLKGKNRCYFRRSRDITLESKKDFSFDRSVFQKKVIKNWFYSKSLWGEDERVKAAIRYIKSGEPKEDADDSYAVTAVASILRLAGFDFRSDFDENIAKMHVILAGRERYVRCLVEDTYEEMPFETTETARRYARQTSEVLMRYLTQEKRTPFIPEAKVFDIFGIDVVTKPDLVFIDDKTGNIEAVKIACRKPDVTYRSKKPDKNVNNSLELYALWNYAREMISDADAHEIKSSYYFLRKNSDKNDEFAPLFFSEGIASLSETVSKGSRAKLDDLFEPQFEEFQVGTRCSGETCETCDFNEICNFNVPPLKSEEEKKKKSISDISLSPEQEKAVFLREGIARVNAGAGAGKTLVVALRTAYMLDEGIDPEDILLVTFTDAGATEMRERIQMYDEDLGTGTDIDKIHCMTFNAFGNEIIKKEYKRLGFTGEPRLIDNIERKDIITGLLQDTIVPGLDYKNFMMDMPHVKGALAVCEEAFRVIKRDRISSFAYDELAEALEPYEKSIKDDLAYKTLLELYEAYDMILQTKNLIEFQDQERLLFDLLDLDPYYFDSLGYKHVVVDEFQDSSDNQIALVKSLIEADSFESLMIVGDDSQSIFGFREACPDNIISFFDKIGEDGEDIFITENHRSTPEILGFANKLNALNRHRVEKDLIATRPSGKDPVVKGFHSISDEYEYIAQVIKEKLSEGIAPDDIAIIAAQRSELLKIATVLTEEGIEAALRAPEPMLENSRVLGLIALANTYEDPQSSKDILVFQNCLFEGKLLEYTDDDLKVFIDDGSTLVTDIKKKFGPQKVKFFEELCCDIAGDDDLAMKLVERLKRFPKVEDRISYIKKFEKYGGEALKRDGKYSGVGLFTAHSSKGLEWPVVINSISKYDRKGISEAEEEERRRLLFVSATRARDELYITGQVKLSGSKDNYVYNRFVREVHDITGTPLTYFDEEKEEKEKKEKEESKARVKRNRAKKKEKTA